MKLRCLVTGGNGFIGRHVCAALQNAGHQFRVLDIAIANQPLSGAEQIVGSFADSSVLEQGLRGCDSIIHLGWTSLPASSNQAPLNDVKFNIGGTIRLLEQAVAAGVKTVIFASSGGTVYGLTEETPVAEGHPTQPLCSYGISKLTVEKYLEFFHHHHGLRTISLRIANPYGPGQDPHKPQGAVAVFSQFALDNQTAEIWGDGHVVRDFIYIQDVAQAFAAALSNDQAQGVFNIGSGVGTSLNDLIYLIEQTTQKTLKRRHHPPRQFDVPVSVLDVQKAKEILQWQPTTPFEKGLLHTMTWLNARSHL